MSDQQSQQIALVYKLSTEAGLQIRGSEQELLAACFSIQDACSILLILIASTLASLGLAAHISNGLPRFFADEWALRQKTRKTWRQVMRLSGPHSAHSRAPPRVIKT
jgi:hypothetical protein